MAISRRLTLVGCVAVAAAGMIVGLGALPANAGTAARAVNISASSEPASGTTVTATESSNQTTIALVVGQTLVVSLPSNYQPPAVVPSGVLAQRGVVGGYPTGQPLVAMFVAVAPGHVTISTMTDAQCLHTTPRCAMPQRLWTLHVTVTA